MNTQGSFVSSVGKLMVILIAVIVAIWLALTVIKLIGWLMGLVLPLLFIGFVIWFAYKILVSNDPKVG